MKHEIQLTSKITVEFMDPAKALARFREEWFRAEYAVLPTEAEAAKWVCRQICDAEREYGDDIHILNPEGLETFRLVGQPDGDLPDVWVSESGEHGVIVATVSVPEYAYVTVRDASSHPLQRLGGANYRQIDTGDPNTYCDKCAAENDRDLCYSLSGGPVHCPQGHIWKEVSQ